MLITRRESTVSNKQQVWSSGVVNFPDSFLSDTHSVYRLSPRLLYAFTKWYTNIMYLCSAMFNAVSHGILSAQGRFNQRLFHVTFTVDRVALEIAFFLRVLRSSCQYHSASIP